jgi:uncharacterized membrane protein YfcA
MDPLEVAAIAAGGFVAAAINAVAGGGTLISFPVLVGVGFSAKVANITNAVGVAPGFLGGSLAYREELRRQPRNVRAILLPAVLGAIAGSAILLATPESAFEAIVPFLILAACALLAFQDKISALFFGPSGLDSQAERPHLLAMQVPLFFTAVYGAYFGAAMGIILLATFGMTLPDDIQRSNALKGLVALIVNGLAAAYFAVFGDVDWTAAAIMAAAAVCGGYLGANLARRLPRQALRRGIIVYGTLAAIVLLVT